jgi:hypothetical protein
MIGVGAVGASGTAEEVDTGDVVTGAVTLEVDATSGMTDGVSIPIWLAATVPFVSVLSVAVEDDTNELAAELGDVDDDPTGFDVPCRVVASILAVSEARGDAVDAVEALPLNEPWDVDVSSVAADEGSPDVISVVPASGFG